MDSSGLALPGADVAVWWGLGREVAHGTADSAGVRTLVVPRDSAGYGVVIRRIGYYRGDRFFPGDRGSVSFDVVLARIAQRLDTARIAAAEDEMHRDYTINAWQIANATVRVANARDVVERLRRKMIWGRSGPPAIGPVVRPTCGKLQAVIVNGVLIQEAPREARIVADERTPRPLLAGALSRDTRALAYRQYVYVVSGLPAAVLTSIRAEHIAEMQSHDCFDKPIPGATGIFNAVFITLKPGIAYSTSIGSYVVHEAEVGPRR